MARTRQQKLSVLRSQIYSRADALCSILLEGIQEFLDSHLRLPENVLQNRNWQIETVVPRNGYPEVRLLRMSELNVASSLMIDFESRPLQRSQKLPEV